ncbi:histone deacetylase HDT2 isoform X2 [Elaeis guineensis]|uniref:Histone deacetylase HDT2 isoform X2 n=1 Tax=Elaeis guineensis var. tenera TaxID=51953 RepID=A0A6I9QJD8_ELAGV|nr:histone deacetylase HDT2 isoform X2 [Elaeis guineensis]
MEFWGVEVKPGETVECDPGQDKYLHLSQASLGGELKKDKGNENVPIFVKFNDKKLVLGTLSAEKCAQISYDLVFEKEFELSHSSKNASVFFCGYKTIVADDDEIVDFQDSDFDSEEDVPLGQKVNGKTEVKDEQVKPTTGKAGIAKADASAAKPKVRIEEPNKADKQKVQKADEDDEDDEEDESEEDDNESEEGSDDDEDIAEADDDSDDEDDDESSDEEDAATPQKPESGKKRLVVSASKTPVPGKKAKLVSPVGMQETGGHTATPHPAKHAGKTPANSDKPKQQSPKSAGLVSCKSCNKMFNSENALQAHSKAKHGTAK